MSIPFICRTAMTHDAAASPSVAVSVVAVAALLVFVIKPGPEAGAACVASELSPEPALFALVMLVLFCRADRNGRSAAAGPLR
jgi:hypothetical protein